MDPSSSVLRPVLQGLTNTTGTYPITIVETGSKMPNFKTKPKRKRIIVSVPLFKTESIESDSVTDALHSHSNYTQNVFSRKLSHDPRFGVYQDDTVVSFKIGRSSFKYNNKHVFVNGKSYTSTQGLWEILTQSRPVKTWPLFKTGM